MAFMTFGMALGYTIGDESCDGVEESFIINISSGIAYNNSAMNITVASDYDIFFEGYNDTGTWIPEGKWAGFTLWNTAVPTNLTDYEYLSFDVDGLDWAQDYYSGFFVVALCNTTTQGADDIEVCYRYQYNLDGLTRDFLSSDSGERLILTPTGCRYWNKSQEWWNYEDSDPCDYPSLDYTDMRVYAWAEYSDLEPFTGTIGNITFEVGENKLTSYDCAEEATVIDSMLANYSSGWKLVTGILQSHPTTDPQATYSYGWNVKQGDFEDETYRSIVLVDENAYASGIYYDYGMNITKFVSMRDGYHNVTVRYLYDATTWDVRDLDIQTDNGLVDEIPIVYLEDYNDIDDYKLEDEGTFYMNVYSKYHVSVEGDPIHKYFGCTRSCGEGSYTFDGEDYEYSYCSSLVDFTDSPITYVAWTEGYALGTKHPYATYASDLFYGKTLIGEGVAMFAYQPSDYFVYDRPSLTNFDVVGDGTCGIFESGNSIWNYEPACDVDAQKELHKYEPPALAVTGVSADPLTTIFAGIGNWWGGVVAWFSSLLGLA